MCSNQDTRISYSVEEGCDNATLVSEGCSSSVFVIGKTMKSVVGHSQDELVVGNDISSKVHSSSSTVKSTELVLSSNLDNKDCAVYSSPNIHQETLRMTPTFEVEMLMRLTLAVVINILQRLSMMDKWYRAFLKWKEIIQQYEL